MVSGERSVRESADLCAPRRAEPRKNVEICPFKNEGIPEGLAAMRLRSASSIPASIAAMP
jgi:hypothetical protein